ncbi:hypothetical protein VAZ01S_017_01050 [Vibrio azureus NBRC 104587]|uniref:DUF3137 domain-containing protein n=3 Tax=Vibrio azureus TaxID=512649 RepID=U3AML2_9VIBR|nr:hypothetical protein VAZ01S_017_01050 [Vibrio azureus NBRC 104587]
MQLSMFRGTPFAYYWPDLRKEVQIVIEEEDPKEPISSVSDDVLTLRTGSHLRRNFVLIPLLIMFTAFSSYIVNFSPRLYHSKVYAADMTKYHKQNVAKFTKHSIEAKKNGDIKKYKHYQKVIEKELKEIEILSTYLEKEGSITIFTHIKALAIANNGELETFLLELAIFVGLYGVTLFFWVFFLLKPRDAEVYFDRRKQIVYSWRAGRVGAAAFDKVGLMTNNTGLCIVLNFETKKRDGYVVKAMPAIDIDNFVGHVSSDYIYTLGQILAFMDDGKEALIAADSFERPQTKFFLRDSKKPEDLEARIEAALKGGEEFLDKYQSHIIWGFGDFNFKK